MSDPPAHDGSPSGRIAMGADVAASVRRERPTVPMSAVFTERMGRVAFFVHGAQPDERLPAIVQKWIDHEQSMLGARRRGDGFGTSSSEWSPGDPCVVWRLLSGNNREIGRGIGVFGSLDAARAAAERAMVGADRAEAVMAFDRRSNQGWYLRFDGDPLVVSPVWHRNRRSNRLNLELVCQALARADVNGAAKQLGAPSRMRHGSAP